MLAKKHEHQLSTTLAVCDKEHLGKTYEDGNLSFTVSVKFYGGDEITESEFLELIKEVNSVNLFGNKCVSIAEKEGLISSASIITIKGNKHAQIYKI